MYWRQITNRRSAGQPLAWYRRVRRSLSLPAGLVRRTSGVSAQLAAPTADPRSAVRAILAGVEVGNPSECIDSSWRGL
jgi:hypothetical protein